MRGAKNALSAGEEPNIGIIHNAVNETRTSEPTPDQLIQLLDSQLTLARADRVGDRAPRRAALLVGGMIFIVAGCCVALLILQQMLSDLHEIPPAANPQTGQSTAQSNNY